MQAGEVGQGVDRSQGREAQTHELFAGHDYAAEGQMGLPGLNRNYTLQAGGTARHKLEG